MPRNQFDININLKGFPEAQANLDKTKQGMDRMRISTSGLKRQIGALRNNMLLYAFTIGAIQRVTNNLITTYRKQIEAERLLENNLRNIAGVSSEASANLKALASGLQQVTTFGDEAIISAQSLLATFQLSEATIAQLTPRILDMSAAMGTDLRSSAILLGKAFIGETSRLKQIGLVIDETGLAMARAKGPFKEAAFLLKTFDNNFRGAAEALRKTPLGELDGLNMALGDLTEQLGRTSVPLETFLNQLKLAAVQGITTWAFFFTEWSKLSKGGLGDVLLISEAYENAAKRVRDIMHGTTKSVKDFGKASVNASSQASLAEAERQEVIDKSIEQLDKQISKTRSMIFATYGATESTIAQVAAQRLLSKKEAERVELLGKLKTQLEARKELEDIFTKTLEGTVQAQRDNIRLTMAMIQRDGEMFGTKEQVKIVLEQLKKAYDDLDPSIQAGIDKDNEYKESIKSSEEALREELRSLQAKADGLSGADLATVRSMELGRALTDTERQLIETIEAYNTIIDEKIEKDESQNTLQNTFNNILKSTTEGEIAHLKALIAKIEANAVLIASDQERAIVLEDLKNKIKELEEEGSTKNLAKDANEMANGFLAASRAMSTLKDSAEITHGQLLQVIGSLMMLAPGGQVPGAVVQSLGMFVGHTGGLIKNNGIQRFAKGGMVQGQDNVPILAQAGEFIMRREAVQNIGVENLAEMNRGQGTSNVTVNIQGNMIGNDEFVRDNLIPQIQKVSRQGLA
jgi:hypothetical protein